MDLHKIIPTFIAYCYLSSIAAAQKAPPSPSTTPPFSAAEHTTDFSETVVPIHSVKITPSVALGISGIPGPGLDLGFTYGTGFCLDAACRFIATNYHVAVTTRAHKIKGETIIQQYLATGPKDKDATLNHISNLGVLPYALGRDLAIFELVRPLPHHHGLTFNLDELEVGQEVDIYCYPKGIINPTRTLTRFPATFKGETTKGLLAFKYQLSAEKPIRIQGGSGGIVVDRKTKKIVGILSGTDDATAMVAAVPVQTLVDFVSKVQPFLAQKIFPTAKEVAPLLADRYPKLAPAPDFNPKFAPRGTGGLQHRFEEPFEVLVLRQKAQHLADDIRNFIAVQSFAWGSGDKEPDAEASYEVRVIDAVQRFRVYPDGKKELEEAPFPHLGSAVRPADEWSQLPRMVGAEYRLKIHQAADVVVNERRMKVFQYYATVEDNLCPFEPLDDYIFFALGKVVAVACYGEVWTDEDTNILRISENLELSDKLKAYKGWEEYQVVLTYGQLQRANEPPRLVPLTIYTKGRIKKHIYWCRGQFTDYQVFSSSTRFITDSTVPVQ